MHPSRMYRDHTRKKVRLSSMEWGHACMPVLFPYHFQFSCWRSPKDFTAMLLLVQNVQETNKIQSNDEHEDENNNLIVVATAVHIHTPSN
jgi:hypothetical protein